MRLSILSDEFTVCKLPEGERMPQAQWCFSGITHEEQSLVCPTAMVPAHTLAREDGWRGFYVDEGTLDFNLIGILAEISGILARAKVGIFGSVYLQHRLYFCKAAGDCDSGAFGRGIFVFCAQIEEVRLNKPEK